MNPRQLSSPLVLFSAALAATGFSAEELLPERWIENVPATDGSVQQSLVFRTVPGVNYRVETSQDLTSWSQIEEIYGMGHEFVVPIREFVPPPPLPPGSPPLVLPPRPEAAPTLLFRPTSGSAGGTIVHWKSLDDGGPMVYRLEANLHEDWEMVPLFSQRYGAYYFFVWHWTQPVSPPGSNPVLGTRDAAMIAQLQASFADMNQLVATSAAATRNAPPPAPSAPGPKKFWRIQADWSVDTDDDGSFDWLEFAVAGNGAHAQQSLANAFQKDSNGDGIPDGSQLDSDGDGTFDVNDLMVKDPLIDWERMPVPVFATFPAPDHVSGPAMQTNIHGMVLFPTAVRVDGETHALSMNGADVTALRSIGMNDKGEILGVGYRNPSSSSGGASNAAAAELILVWWNSYLDSGPTAVTDGQYDAVDVCFSYWQSLQGLNPPDPLGSGFPWDRVLDNSGRFIAQRNADDPGAQPVRRVWKRMPHGFVEGEETGPESLFTYTSVHAEPTILSYGPAGQGTDVWSAGVLQSTVPGIVTRLAPLPSGRIAAIRTGVFRPLIDDGAGSWQASALFPESLTDAGRLASQPLRVGGRMVYLDLVRESPRAWPKVAPVASATAVEHLDASDNGWLLTVEDTGRKLSLPVILENTTFASGVDHVSVTSSKPGPECENRSWVMAPAGPGGLNEFKVKSAAGPFARVTVAAETIPFINFADLVPGAPPSDGTLLLNAPSVSAFVDGNEISTALTGTSIYPTFTLGDDEASTTPLGIRVMKARTIPVKVWIIPRAYGVASVKGPVYTPEAQELDDYLTAIFEPQINAKFDCDIETVDPIAFGSENGADFGGGANSTWEDGYNALDEYGEAGGEMDDVSGHYDPSSSINVYLVGGVGGGQRVIWNPVTEAVEVEKDARGRRVTWNGATDVPGRRCWVIGGSDDGTDGGKITAELIRDTIAHEIGHVIVGSGHPDESSGPAPLPDTPHVHRLMCSGLRRKTDGTSKLLVKAEWDAAEAWMVREEERGRIID